uniref:Pre-mRNA-splicing factor SLU7 n=1 Tax=Ascaris lumbricoides TaxID=6252 RepID=A0A0M3HLX2_ASCLU
MSTSGEEMAGRKICDKSDLECLAQPEDTAKYLYNLDPNGPYYDPKSRSMRENPFAVS